MPLASKTVASPAEFPVFPNVRDETSEPGLNLMVFGPPGVGKTSLLSTIKDAQPDDKILLFDIDVGRESVLDVDIDYALPPAYLEAVANGAPTEGISKKLTWKEIRDYLDTALALKDSSPYRTYAFDSLSSIYYELLIPYVVGSETKKVEWPHYFEAQRLLTKFLRDAKSLSEYGINTLFTGHVKEENDGDITNTRLALPQGIRNEVLLIVNHVGYLERKVEKGTPTETRVLHMAPPKRVDGPKIRQTRSGKQAPLVYEDPSLGILLQAIKESQ
jgi:hypothetical protein